MLNRTDLSRVDLNLLVLFEAVFEERHVGRAAERLRLSPSAISHGLRRLRALLHDPLFLKHPKGVVPTARALALGASVATALAHVREVVASADPFDARTSKRRFTLGAPDGIAAVILPPLLAAIRRAAPGVDLAILDLQPADALAAVDARDVDVALFPLAELPARFAARVLYTEDFVIAMRAGQRLTKTLTVESYCKAQHLLVSGTGDALGFVDRVLAAKGLERRVAVTVPSFMWALAMIAATDLLAALPRRLVAAYGPRFKVAGVDPPLPLGDFEIRAVAARPALGDAGVVWLLDRLELAAANRA